MEGLQLLIPVGLYALASWLVIKAVQQKEQRPKEAKVVVRVQDKIRRRK